MKALSEIYTIHTFAPISDIKVSIKNCFLQKNIRLFWLESAKNAFHQFILGCIDADFCDQKRVGNF